MRYRNLITGAEIEVNSEILALNWVKEGAESPKKAETLVEVPKEPITEEPEPVIKKTAPKKTKRTKK